MRSSRNASGSGASTLSAKSGLLNPPPDFPDCGRSKITDHQITLPHGGGVLPILIGRLDQGWRVNPAARHLPKPPSTYLQRFTYDTIVHSKQAMEFIIRQVGPERVMMGSDYCFTIGYDRPVQFLERLELPGAERAMILGGTAAKLLKL